MKNYILLLLLIVIAVSCSTTEEIINDPELNLEEKLTSNLNVLVEAAVSYGNVLQQTADSTTAFHAMTSLLAEHPDINSGQLHDVGYLDVTFTNGLKSSITIIPVSDEGEHLHRGGGSANKLALFPFTQTRKIKNDKVLVFLPFPEEFYYSASTIAELKTTIESTSLELKADIKTGANVNLNLLDELGDYGFIILSTHGVKHGFVLALSDRTFTPTETWNPEEIINELLNVLSIPADKIASGEIEIGTQIITKKDGSTRFRFQVVITEEYIRNLNIDLSDAVIFGNHCYSGHTADGGSENNMSQAWRSKGAASYYGYAFDDQNSVPVDNDFCKGMERLLIQGLIADVDTTGEANLLADGSTPFYYRSIGYFFNAPELLSGIEPETNENPIYFIQFFDQDYKYEGCGDEFIDIRDGSEYQTVCIGDQIWMAENLRYLPIVHSNTEFEEAGDNTQPGYGVYGYDGNNVTVAKEEQNYSTYGVLYNWMAAMAGQVSTNTNPSGVQGICPDGWHLPSKAEWDELINFLDGANTAGGKLKESGTSHWNSPNTGATNETGFTGLPGGYYHYNGFFNFINEVSFFWSTSDTISGSGLLGRPNLLKYNDNISFIGAAAKENGYSCRCVKDD